MTLEAVDPREALVLVDRGAVVLDVRAPEEFADGHPACATNVPLASFVEGRLVDTERFVERARALCPSTSPTLVLCRSGARAERAARLLSAGGVADVRVVLGGYEGTRGPFGEVVHPGWRRLGLP
jgi:hydroxyacylglutathione hydrolase